MITEDCISFETAKLLKEKGFDGDTNCYYIEGSVEKNTYYSPIRQNHNKRITNNEFGIDINISSGKMSAPTLQMAMKWLREIKALHIMVDCIGTKNYLPTVQNTKNANDYKVEAKCSKLGGNGFDSYEQACEAAIKYCLENLI